MLSRFSLFAAVAPAACVALAALICCATFAAADDSPAAGDKNAAAGDKEAADKEAGDKEAGDKEAADKEAGDKEAAANAKEAAANAKEAAARKAALAAAKDKVTNLPVTLKYEFKKDEVIRSEVTHLVTVETRIQGVSQTARTRSVATKIWRIKSIDAKGNITFEHVIEKVDMWQSVSGRKEIRYNSEKDKDPPAPYAEVAKTVGKPMATIKIRPNGQIIAREDVRNQFNPGIGDLTVPLPSKPVKVGAQWHTPEELRIRLSDGRFKKVQTRQVYTLEKVQVGVATIKMKTEVITPITDPRVESQLVQRIKTGKIKFDVDAGRVISKQMDMDKSVVGFQGADSSMNYLARFTEKSLPEDRTATRPAATKVK